jgi:hypothetical protein
MLRGIYLIFDPATLLANYERNCSAAIVVVAKVGALLG